MDLDQNKLTQRTVGLGVAEGAHRQTHRTRLDLSIPHASRSRVYVLPNEKIVADVSQKAKGISKEKTRSYAKKYPNTLAKIVERAVK